MERDVCKRSLVDFIRCAWHVLEPSEPYVHGWHMDAIGEHLEAITAGKLNRLLINIPPGTMKSMASAVFFPAWEWGPMGLPNKRFIGASHEGGLATRDNMKMRRLVTSEWYQRLWPTILTNDQNEKNYFENDKTGWRQACPVKSMTGRRGDCLTGDAIIETSNGQISIREIVENVQSCSVLSLDHDTGRLVYRPVQAVARSSTNEIYRVHTSEGVVVECTGDHRFYTSRGYVVADLLSTGDMLMRAVQSGCSSNSSRNEENNQAGKVGGVLQRCLCANLHESRTGETRPVVQCLRSENTEGASAMFPRVCKGGTDKACRVEEARSGEYELPDMQPRSATKNEDCDKNVLFSQMRGVRSFAESSESRESDVARRRGREAVRLDKSQAVSKDTHRHIASGWEFVRVLRREDQPMCSPHGSRHGEQHMEKPCDTLQGLSCDLAQQTQVQLANTTVTMVERVFRSEVVYDIQVEGTRNFFANGVLVHNCVLWDDPHSVEDAHSVAALESANRVFRETLPTRLNNPEKSAIIILMQRLNQKDVSGEIITHGLGYEHLCLPMEWEGPRKKTILGFVDPRKNVGDLLFPGRFPADVVERDKKIMGTYAVAGQFQQRPSPAGGGIIKTEHFRLWPASKSIPDLFFIVQSYDTAHTEKTTGDPTGCQVWGVFEYENTRQALLLDCWNEYLGYPALKKRIMDDWQARYGGEKDNLMKPSRRADVILVENKSSGISIIQDLRQSRVPVVPYNPGNADKVARAHLSLPLLESGVFWVLESPKNQGKPRTWVLPFLDQLEQFPAGEHDEMVDCFSQAVIYLKDACQLDIDVVPEGEPDDDDRNVRRKASVNPYG